MIISASRRTDLPAFYGDWFFARLRAGFVLCRNPMRPTSVSQISLRPEDLLGVVFWTKNPEPIIGRLELLSQVPFYFQFTLNGYGPEVEPGVPALSRRLEAFRRIAETYGPERLVLRVDPLLYSARYPLDWHLDFFGRICHELRGCTDQATISFLDRYRRIERRIAPLCLLSMEEGFRLGIARGFAQIARENGLRLCTCAEAGDYAEYGIERGSCVDAGRLSLLRGWPLVVPRDRNQRAHCGCAASVDIGAYHTCGHFCRYCYANCAEETVRANLRAHDPASALMLGELDPQDEVRERAPIR